MPGIYLHIPFCEKKCSYCDFYSITNKSKIEEFVFWLQKEIELYFNHELKARKKVHTLYLGGGTPSLLEPEQIDKIISTISHFFDVDEISEFTVECNPGTNFTNKLADYKSLGINRISIGVQSLVPEELIFLDRIHTAKEAMEAITMALNFFENVSVDIIFSIPNQTIASISKTLEELTKLDIKHISAYSLIYEEKTPLYNELLKGNICPKTEEQDFEIYKFITSTLSEHNFIQYEVSNFAKSGFKSLHNLNYWRYGEYFGFGPSAHSFFNNKRSWNVRNLDNYFNLLKSNRLPIENFEHIDTNKRILEKIMLGLRSEGIPLPEFKQEFGIDLVQICGHIFEAWKAMGKAIINNNLVKLTPEGYFIADKLTLDLVSKIEKFVTRNLGESKKIK